MDRNRDLAQGLSRIENVNVDSMSPNVIHIDDTVQHHGPFYAITALADAVVDVSQCNTGIIEGDGSSATQAIATNFTIPKGVTIHGNFTSIELDSGSALAYARRNVNITVD